MIQHELADMTDIFGVKGLKKLSKIQLPRQDMIALARYLEELKMHVSHHRQLDTEIARIAASDNDVHLLMTIPGIKCFTAVGVRPFIPPCSLVSLYALPNMSYFNFLSSILDIS